jgi:threonine aldolase
MTKTGADMEYIDLRSDTVTQPTPSMRAAMANAEVGDDVFGEDPSINRLQAIAAERMGKEAGLFLPTGTMGNLAAVLTHCGRGDEAIMGDQGHTFLSEGGGIAALGGVQPRTIPNQADGTIDLEAVKAAIRPDDPHHPISRLVILENTHNRCGGMVLPPEYMQRAGEVVHQNGLLLHLDGARIFNAAAALGVKTAKLTAPADSVTFCLSKGLCAPVGSVLCGSRDFIRRAIRTRKQLGGGMRQAGILAAAGIVALEQMVDRLPEDHRRAKMLAEGIQNIKGLKLDKGLPQTNMVFVSLAPQITQNTREVAQRMAEKGVKIGVWGSRQFRLVLHYWIDDAGVQKTVEAFSQVLGSA